MALLLLGIVVAAATRLVDPRSAALLGRTAALVGATMAIGLPLGVVIAVVLVRTDVLGRRASILAWGWLLFVPLYLLAGAWQAAFGASGWLTMLPGGAAWIDGWRGAVWIHALAAVPWVALVVGLGLWFVEPELEEDALLDASTGQVIRRVTLRRSLPALGVAALWIVVSVSGEMVVTDLFQVRTYAEVLYTDLTIGRPPGEAALRTLPGVLLTGWIALAALGFCAHLVPARRLPEARARFRLPLRAWRGIFSCGMLLLLLVAVAVPIGSLIYKAGVIVEHTPAGYERSWSPAKCALMVLEAPRRSAKEFGWSLLLGTLTATIVLVLATASALAARGGGPGAWLTLGITAFALALPGPIIGLSIIWLLNRPDPDVLAWLHQWIIPPGFWPHGPGAGRCLRFVYDRTIVPPCLAQVVRALPWATLIMWYALRTIPSETIDSAAVDGAGPWTRLWRIILPQRRAALAVAWLVALVVSLNDLGATILVAPPGLMTLSMHIFNQLHYGIDDAVAALCLANVALVTIAAGAVAWLSRRWRGWR